MANAVPSIGVISGATIIAPMTVAVEFDVIPAVAITAASGSNVQNLVSFRRDCSPSKNSASFIRTMSSAVTLSIRAPSEPAVVAATLVAPILRTAKRARGPLVELRSPATDLAA